MDDLREWGISQEMTVLKAGYGDLIFRSLRVFLVVRERKILGEHHALNLPASTNNITLDTQLPSSLYSKFDISIIGNDASSRRHRIRVYRIRLHLTRRGL